MALPADGTPIAAAARYVLGWEDIDGHASTASGKRIRPALTLAAASAVGGDNAAMEAMPGAVAVELVHNFSLVHDDIQDLDEERHGRPTAWLLYGEAQGINLGDYLHVRAIQALSDAHGDPARRMRALAVLNRATSRMIAGQWRDIAFETRQAVDIDEYLEMIAGKTAALFSAPLEVGAILAGSDDGTALRLGDAGTYLGLAFQVWDDYLGTWGDPSTTGKSNVNDISRRKKTLPVVHGLADPVAGPLIGRAFAGTPSPADVEVVVEALERSGAREFTRMTALGYGRQAVALLDEVGIGADARAALQEIASYLAERPA